jgi:hypothetical protein
LTTVKPTGRLYLPLVVRQNEKQVLSKVSGCGGDDIDNDVYSGDGR